MIIIHLRTNAPSKSGPSFLCVLCVFVLKSHMENPKSNAFSGVGCWDFIHMQSLWHKQCNGQSVRFASSSPRENANKPNKNVQIMCIARSLQVSNLFSCEFFFNFFINCFLFLVLLYVILAINIIGWQGLGIMWTAISWECTWSCL